MPKENYQTLLHADRSTSQIRAYCIKLTEDGHHAEKKLEFEAHDAAKAICLVHNEAPNRIAELWCDGRKICSMMRSEIDLWEIR